MLHLPGINKGYELNNKSIYELADNRAARCPEPDMPVAGAIAKDPENIDRLQAEEMRKAIILPTMIHCSLPEKQF